MKRLVYSPSINVWVKTDTGVFDLSPYVTNFAVDRRITATSYASVTFRNPKVIDERDSNRTRFLFTEHIYSDNSVRPMFHPMDPIIITLTRIKGRPVQVFTGYCDTTPYVQLLPGTAQIQASCTLKRLQYTYWDPALPFVRDFMLANGWGVRDDGTAINFSVEERANASKDSSLGSLLLNILKEIGGWNDKNIYIEGLPESIKTTVAKLYADNAKESSESINQFNDFLHKLIGGSAYGSLSGQSNSSLSNSSHGTVPVAPQGAPQLLQKWITEANRIHNHTTVYSKEMARSTLDHLTNPPTALDGSYFFDCSSFTSYMMKFIGKYGLSYAERSGWFANNWGVPGKGRYMTVWANSEHVFTEIVDKDGKSKFIGTSGSVEKANHGGMYGHTHTVGWLDSYPTAGFTPRHIEGL
jgi:hypothetical protein